MLPIHLDLLTRRQPPRLTRVNRLRLSLDSGEAVTVTK